MILDSFKPRQVTHAGRGKIGTPTIGYVWWFNKLLYWPWGDGQAGGVSHDGDTCAGLVDLKKYFRMARQSDQESADIQNETENPEWMADIL